MKSRSYAFLFLSIIVGALVLTGCPPKKKLPIEEKKAEEVDEAAKSAEEEAARKAAEEAANSVTINQDWTEIPLLSVIQFAYDSSALDETARAALKTNVAIIKKLPKTVTVRVEGHCDDRGTVEYNIALGQRRANAVRSYYVTAGIGRSRLDTISFGEERPVCNFETEDCWAKNRRATTKVKNAEAITVKKSELQ